MYQRYVREYSGLESFRAQCEAAGARGDPEIDELWSRIDDRIRRTAQRNQEPNAAITGADASSRKRHQWGTVRIFISSTFKDFFAERECLVKRVFPSLREWCERRRIALYDYDLRWGVPKDSTGSDAVRTCLELLDRCLAETDGRAFFLGLVGDRFGWVPGPADLDEELQRQYDWTPGSSVTQVEVVHGAMARLSRNALFMIRDSACYAALPDSLRKDFVESAGSATSRQVARQKLEIAQRFQPAQVQLYSVRYAGTVKEGKRERVQFLGLEDFEQRVLDFFQRTIASEYPQHMASEPQQQPDGELTAAKSTETGDDDGESNETHIGYMFSLASNAQGQVACLRLLRGFVEADRVDASTLPPLHGSGNEVSGLKTLLVSGDTGTGKTTVLARLGQEFVDRKGYSVLVHFSQFSPTSGDPRILLKKLKTFLMSLLSSEEAAAFTKETQIQEILESVAQLKDRRILILIDAFECLFESSNQSQILPEAWPSNVRCVATCHMAEVARCCGDRVVHLYQLEPLDQNACRAVCRGYLDEFGKRLDSAQLATLLGKASAANPLWLTQACEELRVFGDYAAVSQVIGDFPDDTHELLKSIAARIVKDNPDGMVATLLALVSVSRVGLWEKNARRMLCFAARRSGGAAATSEQEEAATGTDSDELPLADYLRIRRETKAFLRSIARESTCLTFQHRASRTAVQELLLAEPETSRKWHSIVADFILDGQKNRLDTTLARDMLHHLYWSDRRSEMHKFLSCDPGSRSFTMRIPAITCSYVYNSWRCRHVKVTPASKQASLVVCTWCKNLPSRLGPLRSAACVYCGLTAMPGHSVPAGTCQLHQAVLPTMLRCWFCGRQDTNAVQLSLCAMCSHMSSPMWCSQPLLETDRQFPVVARNQHKRHGLIW